MDVFIGGGGDDLTWLGLGVMRDYADRFARETGRLVFYAPNARVARVARRLRRGGACAPVNLIGHSWGAVDAFNLAARLTRAGVEVGNLITLDAVSGPIGRVSREIAVGHWLDVSTRPSRPDRSDWLTHLPPWSRKPSGLPLVRAHAAVELDLHHWDVAGMMRLSGARDRLEG